jgi:hypothetical protein
MEPKLGTDDLVRAVDGERIVDSVDLRVREGEVVPSSARRGRASPRSSDCSIASTSRPAAPSTSTESDPRPEPDDHATDPVTPDPEPTGFGGPSNGGQSAGTEAVDRLSGRVGDLTECIAALEGRIEKRSPAEGERSPIRALSARWFTRARSPNASRRRRYGHSATS